MQLRLSVLHTALLVPGGNSTVCWLSPSAGLHYGTAVLPHCYTRAIRREESTLATPMLPSLIISMPVWLAVASAYRDRAAPQLGESKTYQQ